MTITFNPQFVPFLSLSISLSLSPPTSFMVLKCCDFPRPSPLLPIPRDSMITYSLEDSILFTVGFDEQIFVSLQLRIRK
jgi:hypothetical protein